MVLTDLLQEGKVKNDGRYHRKEIDKVVENLTTADLNDLKKEIQGGKGKLNAWIDGELKATTEMYLRNAEDKKWVKKIAGFLKQKFPDIWTDLKKRLGSDLASNGDIRHYNGRKGVAVLQAGLNALAKTGKYSSATSLEGGALKVDGLFGKDTAWAVLNYQRFSQVYKNTTLDGNDPRNRMGGRVDLIANGRTVHAIFEELSDNDLIPGGNNSGTDQRNGEGNNNGTDQRNGEGNNNGTDQRNGEGNNNGTDQRNGEGNNNGTDQRNGEGNNNGTDQRNGGGNNSGTDQRNGEGNNNGTDQRNGGGNNSGTDQRNGGGNNSGTDQRNGGGNNNGTDQRNGEGNNSGTDQRNGGGETNPENPSRTCPNPDNPNDCPDTRNPNPNIATREGKMFIPPQKDGVGSVDVVRETPGQKHSVTMSSAELNKYVMDQLKNGNSFDQATKDKIENFMKKSQTYMLLWGLMSADAKIFSDPKNTNFMKDFGRYMNKSPLYTEEGKKMFEQYSKEYQGYLLHLSNAILTGNQQQANSLMDNYKVFDTFFSKDMKTAVSNLGLNNIGGEYFYNKMVSRYKPRFDAGETFAVYEFMSEVMKDNMYSDGFVYNRIDITGTNEEELNKYLRDEPVNTGTIDTFFKSRNITIFEKPIPMPQNRNYGELIKEYRKESLEMEGNIIEPRYVLQRLLEKFLKDHETQIKERFSPDSSQGKFINLFFENRTILNELGKNRSGIAFKTSMSILAAEAVCLGLGFATGGVVTKLMTSTSSVSQGMGKAIQYGTRQLIPALSMVPMSHIMAGDFNSDNIMKDLGNKDTWFMIAMFGSINTAMGKLTTLVSEKTALGRFGNTIKLSGETVSKGNRFIMAGFNMASYLAESGITLGINHMIFDGEFTTEEIVNALLFVGIMRSRKNLARRQEVPSKQKMLPPGKEMLALPEGNSLTVTKADGKIIISNESIAQPAAPAAKPAPKAKNSANAHEWSDAMNAPRQGVGEPSEWEKANKAPRSRTEKRHQLRQEKPWENNQGSENDPKNRYTRVDPETTENPAEQRKAQRAEKKGEKPWENNQGSENDPKNRYTRGNQEGESSNKAGDGYKERKMMKRIDKEIHAAGLKETEARKNAELPRAEETMNNNIKCKGEFKNGNLVSGEMILPNGNILNGEFESGNLVSGVARHTDGTIVKGKFKDGVLVSGEAKFKNGDLVKGEFKDGALVLGKIKYSDGDVHEGRFENGDLISGKITFPDGTIGEGKFKDGALVSGKARYPNGDIHEGKFENGKFKSGQITHTDGSIEIIK